MNETIRIKSIMKLLVLSIIVIVAVWLVAITLPETFSESTIDGLEQVENYEEVLSELKHDLVARIEHISTLDEMDFTVNSWTRMQAAIENSRQILEDFNLEIAYQSIALDFTEPVDELQADDLSLELLQAAYMELVAAYYALELVEIEEIEIPEDETDLDDEDDELESCDPEHDEECEDEELCDPDYDEYCGLIQLSLTREEFESMTREEIIEMAEEGGYAPVDFTLERARSGIYNACPNIDGLGFAINVIVENVVCIETGAQLNAAWSNTSVRRIIMMDNIAIAGAVGNRPNRTTPIEIDGNGRTPDGSMSGNGPQGDGFVLTQDGGTAAFRTNPAAAAYQGDLTNGGGALFYMHSIVIARTGTQGPVGNPAGGALINDNVDWGFGGGSAGSPTRMDRTATWRFRFGNVRTSNITRHADGSWSMPTGASGPGRLVRAQQAEVTFYGEMLLSTRAENVFVGKLLIEDGTMYAGNINSANHSIVWFSARMNANATGSDPSCGALTVAPGTDCRNSVIIGQNAHVQLTVSTGSSAYPPIYAHWRNIVVSDGALYEVAANLPGVAFASNIANTNASPISNATQTFRVDPGGTALISRAGTGLVIASSSPNINTSGGGNASNARVEIMPGASFFAVGSTSSGGVIDLSGTNNQFIMDNPLYFDLRNENTDNNARVFQRHAGASYYLLDTNIVMWRNGAGTGGTVNANTRLPDYVFANVEQLRIHGTVGATGVDTGVTSKEQVLQDIVRARVPGGATGTGATHGGRRTIGGYRRLAGTSVPPATIFLDAVTDADQTIRGGVLLTRVPFSIGVGDDIIGHPVTFRDVLAGPGQADVMLRDSFNDDWISVEIESDGIFRHTDSEGRFQIADETIYTYTRAGQNAAGNDWVQEIPTQTPVLDVTPPEPAMFESTTISATDTTVSGTATEIGAGVTVEIIGDSLTDGRLILTTTVSDDGTWSVDLPLHADPNVCRVNTLRSGYTVQVLLHDGARTLTNPADFNFPLVNSGDRPGVPTTHLGNVDSTQIGNQNPRTPGTGIAYRDATFIPGPIITVSECLVVSFVYNYPEADNNGIFTQVGVSVGGTVAAPVADPIREGYQFVGWTNDAAGTTPFDFEETTINAARNIYAQWIPIVDFEFTKTNQFLYVYPYINHERFKRLEEVVFNLYIWENVEGGCSEWYDLEETECITYEPSEYAWVLLHEDVESDASGLVQFESLVSGNRFRLVEIATNEGFDLPEGHWYVEIATNRTITITRSLDEDGIEHEDVRFVAYEGEWFVGNMPVGVEFRFTKTNDYLYLDADPNDPTARPNHPRLERLSGAEFTLSRWEYDNISNEYAWIIIETVESQTGPNLGLVEFEHLLTFDGEYRLDETRSPSGFRRPHGYWRIVWNETTERFNITAGGTVSLVPAFRFVERQDGDDTIVYYYVGNFPETILPRTGGFGTISMTAIGALSLTFVVLLYIRRKVSDSLKELDAVLENKSPEHKS